MRDVGEKTITNYHTPNTEGNENKPYIQHNCVGGDDDYVRIYK